MSSQIQKIQFTSFLIKIASRCNLACDYCYMYFHADQSWRQQPAIMSEATRKKLAQRIGEYVKSEQLEQVVVVFHGGEPLLAGVNSIVETAKWIREHAPDYTRIDFSVQTNGTLLDESTLKILAQDNIGVSLSIDGPQEMHDKHRVDHKGQSSFFKVSKALELLKLYPQIYTGLITVIDPQNPVKDLFEFFAAHNPPNLDFLLPDANHVCPPPGRNEDSDLYVRWLINAFDTWFDHYSHLPIRTFDAILKSLAGLPSPTDAFGYGDVRLLTIETDGSYHDLDVLKITCEGTTKLHAHLFTDAIDSICFSETLLKHRQLLRYEGLSKKCQICPVVDICGGGSVPHRYSYEGFTNPTVYCREMLALIAHARTKIVKQLEADVQATRADFPGEVIPLTELDRFENPETSGTLIQALLEEWSAKARNGFDQALAFVSETYPEWCKHIQQIYRASDAVRASVCILPSVFLWTHITRQAMSQLPIHSIDGDIISPEPGYVKEIERIVENYDNYAMRRPHIHRNDVWLRLPFGKRIVFEDEETATIGGRILEDAMSIIKDWKPSLIQEMRSISPEIQFIRDLTAHPDKVVSFSDNSLPGALYVSIRQSSGYIDAYDLADSIIHEHRHQKLYLLQNDIQFFEVDAPLVQSPWREDPRPPSGLLHAVFVFTQLLEFWVHIVEQTSGETQFRAEREVAKIQAQLTKAFPTLWGTQLTQAGKTFVKVLEERTKGVL